MSVPWIGVIQTWIGDDKGQFIMSEKQFPEFVNNIHAHVNSKNNAGLR